MESTDLLLLDFKADHLRLRKGIDELKAAARELPELSLTERELLVARIIAFLVREVIPHANAEEISLYPAIEKLLGESAMARMLRDHIVVADFIEDLENVDLERTTELQETLYDLQGVLDTHFEKEEEIYMPLLTRLPLEEQERIFLILAQTEAVD
jgi:iron-sulfur cluster repair protein YtfE (RIC family)